MVATLKHLGIKVFQVYQPSDTIVPTAADYTMLDSGAGSGIPLDWQHLPKTTRPLILAGGITPENVTDAISQVHPDVIDVSSGVETDGQKDATKIRAIIEAAHSQS